MRETLRHALVFAVLWSAGVAVILGFAARPVAMLFTQDQAIINVAVLYFRIVPATYLLGNLVPGWSSAFNAMGLPKRAFTMVVTRQVILMLPFAWLGREFFGAAGLFAGIGAANVVSGIAFHLASRRFTRHLETVTPESEKHPCGSIASRPVLARPARRPVP